MFPDTSRFWMMKHSLNRLSGSKFTYFVGSSSVGTSKLVRSTVGLTLSVGTSKLVKSITTCIMNSSHHHTYTTLTLMNCSLVPRPRPAFRHLQYRNVGRAWYLFSWKKFQNNKLVPSITAYKNATAIGNLTIITCTPDHPIHQMQCDYSQTEPLTTCIHFSSVTDITDYSSPLLCGCYVIQCIIF